MSSQQRPLGGRRARRALQQSAFEQKPFKVIKRRTAPVEIVSADEIEAIHQASLRVLENTGINVLHDEARNIMKQAGADVKPNATRVHFDRTLIEQFIAHAPPSFTLHARNPERNVPIGGDYLVLNMMASAPNVSCADRGRRAGNREDFRDLLRLMHMHNILHINGGYPVEPVDIHASVRHLECIYDFITLSDKVFSIYSLGTERNRDGIEMTRIARGVSAEQFSKEPSVYTIINTNSPLQLDIPMMQGIIEMARTGQVSVITPFTLAGAMAPVTIAGALVLQNAEALAGLAFSQMVKPGAPVMYGGFTSNVDMKSGSPAFGTPEYMQAQHIGGQLARRYNIPYRTSNVCAANTVDAQAAYESVFSLWGAFNSGGNMLKHGAGWLEGGLCCSFEKTILDIDLLQMVVEFNEPIAFDLDALAEAAIDEVGPAGHFFATEHTQARYRDAFYSPILSDWRNYETWQEAGSPTTMEHANRVWKERLAQYEAPPLDPAIKDELEAFISIRKEQGGAPTDF